GRRETIFTGKSPLGLTSASRKPSSEQRPHRPRSGGNASEAPSPTRLPSCSPMCPQEIVGLLLGRDQPLARVEPNSQLAATESMLASATGFGRRRGCLGAGGGPPDRASAPRWPRDRP